MADAKGRNGRESYPDKDRDEIGEYHELHGTDMREELENRPLSPEASLRVALDKLPAPWTKGISDALGLPAVTRAAERRKAIVDRLLTPGSLARVWANLPEPSRRLLHWLVVENGGSATAHELSGEFGPDDDYSWHWNKGHLPTTALGLLRLNGLVYKGMTSDGKRRTKIVVSPVELRENIAATARAPGAFEGAPLMPEPAFRRRLPAGEILEQEAETRLIISRDFSSVFQFLVELEGVTPPVWRRLQVPGVYSFWDLHVAIQDLMPWLDYHLHEFHITDPCTGEQVVLGFEGGGFDEYRAVLPDYEHAISEYFSMENACAGYVYDFGDEWRHQLKLEAILPRKKCVKYPVCLAGGARLPARGLRRSGGVCEFPQDYK